LRYGYQIAAGLEHVHARGIIHRDMKTENVFLTRHDVVKIGDFGISLVLQPGEDYGQTSAGTPYYMAPEMLKGEKCKLEVREDASPLLRAPYDAVVVPSR